MGHIIPAGTGLKSIKALIINRTEEKEVETSEETEFLNQ